MKMAYGISRGRKAMREIKKNGSFIKILLVTTVLLALDYIAHALNILPHLDILPKYYFFLKIVLVPIYFLISIYMFKSNPLSNRNIGGFWLFALASAITLQVRYFFYNYYTIGTQIGMIASHFIMIVIGFVIVNSKMARKFVK